MSPRGKRGAATITCEDGTVVRGETSDELVTQMEAHIRDAHPEMAGKLSREEILGLAQRESPRRARTSATGLLLALLASTSIGAAEAKAPLCAGVLCGEPPYESPRVVPLELEGLRANVLLPPGYDSSERRFPVLYLLHGGAGSENAWLANTDLEAFTAELAEERQAIVVLPDGGNGSIWADWDNGYYLRETWFFESLIPHVDASFRTLADRSHRAVSGLSGGGHGAMHFAARRPDVFVAAGSFSGVLDSASPDGHVIAMLAATLQYACDGHPERADPFGVYGDLVTSEIFIRNHNPMDLATNLRDVALYLAAGNGVPCSASLIPDLQCLATPIAPFPLGFVPLSHAEPVVRAQTDRFHRRLETAGIPHSYDAAQCGIHTYPYFARYLHAFWDEMNAAFGAPPPTSFDYKTADRFFSVWSWDFATDPARAAEFLEVTDATCDGVELRGSGMTTVRTAPCFSPGASISLEGAVEPSAIADPEGRIAFTVDLGPAHRLQQYTPAERLLELLGGYFVERAVAVERSPR